jgi:hypothetical protein
MEEDCICPAQRSARQLSQRASRQQVAVAEGAQRVDHHDF